MQSVPLLKEEEQYDELLHKLDRSRWPLQKKTRNQTLARDACESTDYQQFTRRKNTCGLYPAILSRKKRQTLRQYFSERQSHRHTTTKDQLEYEYIPLYRERRWEEKAVRDYETYVSQAEEIEHLLSYYGRTQSMSITDRMDRISEMDVMRINHALANTRVVLSAIREQMEEWRSDDFQGKNCTEIAVCQIRHDGKILLSMLSFHIHLMDRIRIQENRFIFLDPFYWFQRRFGEGVRTSNLSLRLHSYSCSIVRPSFLLCSPLPTMKAIFTRNKDRFGDVDMRTDIDLSRLHSLMMDSCLPTRTHSVVLIFHKNRDKPSFLSFWKQ